MAIEEHHVFKRLSRRNMVFFIMVSFICTNIIPSASSNQQNLISITILYTGGNGPGNYTQIQDAIDNASSGDTVFVFNGTYYEHIVINKSINLIGDKRNNTIIDGNYDSNAVILIVASDVVVKGFTVRNSEGYSKSAGIKINSPFCTIKDCKIYSCKNGIFINNTNSCLLEQCILCHDASGILLKNSSDTTIANSTFYNNAFGIEGYNAVQNKIADCLFHTMHNCVFFESSDENTIDHCTLVHNNENGGGIFLKNSNENRIIQTFIGKNNGFGIWLDYSSSNVILKSQLVKNGVAIKIDENSQENTISYCNISQNFYGINSHAGNNSFSNKIHHNNFVENVWYKKYGGGITNYRTKDQCDARYNWWNSLFGPSRFVLGKLNLLLGRGEKVGGITETGYNLPSLKILCFPWEKKSIDIDFDLNTDFVKYTEVINITSIATNIENDSDIDGCPDWWENKYGYDPLNGNYHDNLDPDSDGLNNIEEYLTAQWDSDPFEKDIFLEVDWMDDENRLNEWGKQQLADVFKTHNISLHIDDGAMGGGEKILSDGSVDYNECRDFYWDYFLHNNPRNVRKGIFRYTIISSTFVQSGRAGFAFFGWDNLDSFVVTSNSGFWDVTEEMIQKSIACAIMHELGHTLGLFPYIFRGVDEYYNLTYKSCMNYNWFRYNRLIDYSNGNYVRQNSYDDFDDWNNLNLTFFKHSNWEEKEI